MNKEIYLTFDLDWASDDVILFLLNILELENIKSTIFITHDTKLLKRMQKNKNIEVGIHPNFMQTMDFSFRDLPFLEYAEELLKHYKKIVPEATTIRSHGLIQSSRLLDIIKDHGFERESNLLFTLSSQINVRPFRHWNGLIRVPYFWEDDIHATEIKNGIYTNWNVERFLYSNVMKIFDFHPIHIFLNTETLDRYEKARLFFHNTNKLKQLENKIEKGSRTFLLDLIKLAKSEGYSFKKINEINEREFI